MKLTIAGRTHEIEQIHNKPNSNIQVSITWEGRAIVQYRGGKMKFYITTKENARKMWAAA